MDPTIPYLACVLGAAAIYALLRPGPRAIKAAATIVGLGTFAWVLIAAAELVADVGSGDVASSRSAVRPEIFFMIFSIIAVASAVRMITHSKPVYSALYFIMVVLSSSALFLLLEAEFMAFALVIVYAGAILITYMFVLMLAQPTPAAGGNQHQVDYDATSREPGYAAGVGFILLAVLTRMVFGGVGQLAPPPGALEARLETWRSLEAMPNELRDMIRQTNPTAELVATEGDLIQFKDGRAFVMYTEGESNHQAMFVLPDGVSASNIQRVGLELVAKFPVSLELAGIILLMAMFGAVVLARKQIEMGEDEVREAAGMRRLDLHADEPSASTEMASPESRPRNGGGR
jgi:NADH-quinone oxidoreductase subunit J